MATVESVDEVSELTLSRICYDKRSALDACQLYKSLDEGLMRKNGNTECMPGEGREWVHNIMSVQEQAASAVNPNGGMGLAVAGVGASEATLAGTIAAMITKTTDQAKTEVSVSYEEACIVSFRGCYGFDIGERKVCNRQGLHRLHEAVVIQNSFPSEERQPFMAMRDSVGGGKDLPAVVTAQSASLQLEVKSAPEHPLQSSHKAVRHFGLK